MRINEGKPKLTAIAQKINLQGSVMFLEVCMRGKVKYRAERDYWYVQWGNRKVSRYKGFLCRDGEIHGLTGEVMANKLLHMMQGDKESCSRLGIPFQVERYLEQKVDTIPYMRKWLESIKPTLSPATYKDYLNSIQNHLIPWLMKNPYRLHELKYDVLCKLVGEIQRVGKGKRNVMYALHACLDYACKSGHILSIPPFPEKKKYGIMEKKRKGLTTDRQEGIIRAIPEYHQPIFWWLKYHYRRPSEACALYKEDYDPSLDAFTIRRSFSNRQMVDYTKTHKEHSVPCNPSFKPIMDRMVKGLGPFFFTNQSRDCKTIKKGRHYTLVALEYIWDTACINAGEYTLRDDGKKIPIVSLYPGTKHSACWQFLNEKGGTVDELQTLTDHARRDSVNAYTEMEIEAKRRLMGKVILIQEKKDNGSR